MNTPMLFPTAPLRGYFCALALFACSTPLFGLEVYVAPDGSDQGDGTRAKPFATVAKARDAVRGMANRTEAVQVILRPGVYYLPETFVLGPEDSGTESAPVAYRSEVPLKAVLSGGLRIQADWQPFRDGILRAEVPAGLQIDQLFVDGERQPMARYPNVDPKVSHFSGFAPDAFSAARAARWQDPRGGFMHAMHAHEWGDFHYRITGKNAAGELVYEGGWQNNRRMGMHAKYRMVENIMEELDAPGEWFHDTAKSTLYFLPKVGFEPRTATIEVVRLRHLVEIRGTAERPVRFVTVQGLTFRHAARTFMDNKEPLLRSDWTTYRGGAVVFDGTEDCALEGCWLDQVGGNAVFVNKFNRRVKVRGCHIAQAGANGVAFVGDPSAVRSPLFEYGERQSVRDIDRAPGPKSEAYPADCLVDDCLIYQTGRVEKQTAPIQISMSRGITVRHCSIYDVPRAGINISEGTFGGHVIEFCDVFDTVKETGDHGSFNSWGRDRYWGLKDIDLNQVTLGDDRELPILDMVAPNILRNNRWRCDHGWDIDLDDGSSRYELYNNLCLNGGIKLREGFYRRCENNIMVNNSFHPHVWYRNSQDVFRHNIVFGRYQPIQVQKPWGKECDRNLVHQPGLLQPTAAISLQQQSGGDAHSLAADAQFVDAPAGDYRLKEGSPALKLGFQNFPMDQFGVQKPELKALALRPVMPHPQAHLAEKRSNRDGTVLSWWGASIKNIVGPGEVSAAGLPGESGVLLLEVPLNSQASKAGLRRGDVILSIGDATSSSVSELRRLVNDAPIGRRLRLQVMRDQQRVLLDVNVPAMGR